jgi:hypothetical protein
VPTPAISNFNSKKASKQAPGIQIIFTGNAGQRE